MSFKNYFQLIGVKKTPICFIKPNKTVNKQQSEVVIESFENNVEKSVEACDIRIMVIAIGILIQHLI